MSDETLDEYANGLFSSEDDMLAGLAAEAQKEGLPSIQVPPETGRLLTVCLAAVGATSVLEIGMLFGYSTIIMARALPPGGRLVTLEVNPKHAQIAQRNINSAGQSDKVSIRQGPALESLSALANEVFDLVFIDANKDGYPEYLERVLALTRPGSCIVADNVWRGGSVRDPHDEAAEAIARFNDIVSRHPRLISTMIATRGGEDAASVSIVRPE